MKSQDIKNKMESSTRLAEKQDISDLTKGTSFEIKSSNLEQELDQFNKKLQDTPKTTDAQETMEYQTPLHVQKNTESESIDE